MCHFVTLDMNRIHSDDLRSLNKTKHCMNLSIIVKVSTINNRLLLKYLLLTGKEENNHNAII